MRHTRNAIALMLAMAADAVFGQTRALRLKPFDPTGFNSVGFSGFGNYAKDGEDTTAGGGGGDTVTGDDGDDGGGDPPPAMVPKTEAERAFRARDEAKRQHKAFMAMLGLDPKHTKLEPTDDPDCPYRVITDGEDVTDEITGKKKSRRSNNVPDEVRAVEQRYNRRMAEVTAENKKRENALITVIDELSALTPLRSSFAASGAIDSGGKPGEYTDVIELARKWVRTEIERDDEGEIVLDSAGRPKITVTPLNADGTPMVDKASGQPVSLDEFAKRFLEKRPAFKKNSRPGGAGAGGNNAPAGRSGASDIKSAARAAGLGLFGLSANGNGR